MKSGMLAAETAYAALYPHLASTKSPEAESAAAAEADEGEAAEGPLDMSAYETAVKESWIYKELHEVRNLRPSFHNPLGLWGGMAYSGVDSLVLKGRVPWTFRNKVEDYEATKKISYVFSCVGGCLCGMRDGGDHGAIGAKFISINRKAVV